MVYSSSPYSFDTQFGRDIQQIGLAMEAYLTNTVGPPACAAPHYSKTVFVWNGVVGNQGEYKRNTTFYAYNCSTVQGTTSTNFYIPITTRVIQGCPANVEQIADAFVCYTPGSIPLGETTTGNCDDVSKVPVGTTRYKHTIQDVGVCVVTLQTLTSVFRNEDDVNEYWRGLWGVYVLRTTGEIPSQFDPIPENIPTAYVRPANPNDPEDPDPNDPDDPDGPGWGPIDWGSFTGPTGPLYTGRGVTLQQVLETRKPQLLATNPVAAVSTFFTVTHAGQCMPWGIAGSAMPWGQSVVFDFHCTEEARVLFDLMKAAILMAAAFMAFRIAIE